ncbi:GNAT family N-acetyltransferase [Sphingobium nicotianae]|uniref:GNAT family N-acetyltransferase n=1 Tax=Sphingobium nicotianae TaxID=2782607 RepID=A0A9X1AJ29_9SPHN|nr:GNAT family N-acetyltransferase [Sphingobium nicotianae]MBT2185364.1 GNAT family N-acetyltransferase [Sphingobium nicotianae]
MTSALDRPAWNALNSLQAHHARRHGPAVRFDPEIGPLSAAETHDEAGLAALAALALPGEILAFIERDAVPLPPDMTLERQSPAVQMAAWEAPAPFDHPDIVPLGDHHGPEMRALAELTRPGPFTSRTHMLGQFWGIIEDGRLIAMAGERMRFPGHGEVSAVCVHPDAQGRGLGTLMVRKAMSNLAAQGLQPFLHAYADNEAAIATYRRCGFTLRSEMMITMVRKED